MKISTTPGTVYILTSAAPCQVTATNPAGDTSLLAATNGGQATFQAISLFCEVSEPTATVLPVHNAELTLSESGSGTGGESATVDQNYNPASSHAQSGKAVAQAIDQTLSTLPTPEPGEKGDKGDPGEQGAPGQDGESAYQIAVRNGYQGDESSWLASLKGDKGDKGDPGALKNIDLDFHDVEGFTQTKAENESIAIGRGATAKNGSTAIGSPAGSHLHPERAEVQLGCHDPSTWDSLIITFSAGNSFEKIKPKMKYMYYGLPGFPDAEETDRSADLSDIFDLADNAATILSLAENSTSILAGAKLVVVDSEAALPPAEGQLPGTLYCIPEQA